MRRTMAAAAGSITASRFAVWTATITQCEPGVVLRVSCLPVEVDLRHDRVGGLHRSQGHAAPTRPTRRPAAPPAHTRSRPGTAAPGPAPRSGAWNRPRPRRRGPPSRRHTRCSVGTARTPVTVGNPSRFPMTRPARTSKNDELPGAHVRDEQPGGGRLNALIVKAGGTPRQRDVGNQAEWRIGHRCRRDSARPGRFERRAGACATGAGALGARAMASAMNACVSISDPPSYGLRR
jgi:hypothetical protein